MKEPFIEDLKQNWNKHPIFDIYIANKRLDINSNREYEACDKYQMNLGNEILKDLKITEEYLFNYEWEGLPEGCDCSASYTNYLSSYLFRTNSHFNNKKDYSFNEEDNSSYVFSRINSFSNSFGNDNNKGIRLDQCGWADYFNNCKRIISTGKIYANRWKNNVICVARRDFSLSSYRGYDDKLYFETGAGEKSVNSNTNSSINSDFHIKYKVNDFIHSDIDNENSNNNISKSNIMYHDLICCGKDSVNNLLCYSLLDKSTYSTFIGNLDKSVISDFFSKSIWETREYIDFINNTDKDLNDTDYSQLLFYLKNIKLVICPISKIKITHSLTKEYSNESVVSINDDWFIHYDNSPLSHYQIETRNKIYRNRRKNNYDHNLYVEGSIRDISYLNVSKYNDVKSLKEIRRSTAEDNNISNAAKINKYNRIKSKYQTEDKHLIIDIIYSEGRICLTSSEKNIKPITISPINTNNNSLINNYKTDSPSRISSINNNMNEATIENLERILQKSKHDNHNKYKSSSLITKLNNQINNKTIIKKNSIIKTNSIKYPNSNMSENNSGINNRKSSNINNINNINICETQLSTITRDYRYIKLDSSSKFSFFQDNNFNFFINNLVDSKKLLEQNSFLYYKTYINWNDLQCMYNKEELIDKLNGLGVIEMLLCSVFMLFIAFVIYYSVIILFSAVLFFIRSIYLPDDENKKDIGDNNNSFCYCSFISLFNINCRECCGNKIKRKDEVSDKEYNEDNKDDKDNKDNRNSNYINHSNDNQYHNNASLSISNCNVKRDKSFRKKNIIRSSCGINHIKQKKNHKYFHHFNNPSNSKRRSQLKFDLPIINEEGNDDVHNKSLKKKILYNKLLENKVKQERIKINIDESYNINKLNESNSNDKNIKRSNSFSYSTDRIKLSLSKRNLYLNSNHNYNENYNKESIDTRDNACFKRTANTRNNKILNISPYSKSKTDNNNLLLLLKKIVFFIFRKANTIHLIICYWSLISISLCLLMISLIIFSKHFDFIYDLQNLRCSDFITNYYIQDLGNRWIIVSERVLYCIILIFAAISMFIINKIHKIFIINRLIKDKT